MSVVELVGFGDIQGHLCNKRSVVVVVVVVVVVQKDHHNTCDAVI